MVVVHKQRAMYFNPRPREEGDVPQRYQSALSPISIHALVKRATIDTDITLDLSDISIHALVKRATGNTARINSGTVISIHALVKRATQQTSKNRVFV